MKRTSVIKVICYVCIAGGLACKLLIKDALLGSILGIGLMAISIIILGILISRNKK